MPPRLVDKKTMAAAATGLIYDSSVESPEDAAARYNNHGQELIEKAQETLKVKQKSKFTAISPDSLVDIAPYNEYYDMSIFGPVYKPWEIDTLVTAESRVAKDIITGLCERIPRPAKGIDNGKLTRLWAHNHVRWKSFGTKSLKDFTTPALNAAAFERMFIAKMRPTIAAKSDGYRHIRYKINALLGPYGGGGMSMSGKKVTEWLWPDAAVFPASLWNKADNADFYPQPLRTIRIASERQTLRSKNLASIKTFLGLVIRSPATSPWNFLSGKPYANAISSDLVNPLQFFLRVSTATAI